MVLSNYRACWKGEFERYPSGLKLEYPPLDVAWKAAKYSGMKDHYPHFFAKSGYFAFFLYDIERFWVYDLFRTYLVDNALTGCNVRRTVFNPTNLDEAIAFMREMVRCGNLIWVSWMQPLLVYGVEDLENGVLVHWHNPVFAQQGTTWGRDELERWWNWADFEEAKLMIAPTGIAPGVNTDEEITVELAKLAVRNGEIDEYELSGVKIPFGLKAYERYADDLRNPDVDFLEVDESGKPLRTAWFDFSIYCQWTQTFAAHSYFSYVSSIFTGVEKEHLSRAAEHYSRAYGHWLEWEKLLGRHPDQSVFSSRLSDIAQRSAAADAVDRARGEVKKAIESLADFLSSKNISLEDEDN